MSANRIGDLIDQMRIAAAGGDRPGSAAPDREQIKQLAAQFESMLLVQMLRDMRQAGKWDDGDSPESGGLGADALFETIDVELASHLSKVKGFGLSQELFDALGGPGVGQAVSPAESGSPEGLPHRSEGLLQTSEESASSAHDIPLRFSVAPGSVTSDFGWRRDPFTGKSTFHRGMDVRAAYGDEIQAAGGGRVVFSGEQGGYGITVVVEHGNGVRSRYAHLSAAVVQEGDRVAPGQVLGRAGRSGRATGTHLHFEVTADGRPVNPAEWGLASPRTMTGD